MLHLIVALALSFLVSCGNSVSVGGSGGGASPADKPDPNVGEFGYKFEGVLENKQKCSTGVKNYANLQELCVGVQDNTKNNACALSERRALWEKRCVSSGVSFQETHLCQYSLLKKEASVNEKFEFSSGDVLASFAHCAGRDKAGNEVEPVQKIFPVYGNLSVYVRTKFVTYKNESDIKHSEIGFIIIKKESDGSTIALPNPIEYNKGGLIKAGTLDDGAFKYVVRCDDRGSCD